jgi:uncharacterized protein (TIGR03435 family)
MRIRVVARVVATVALCVTSDVKAQERFEAASVKRSRNTQTVVPAVFRDDRWSAQGATLVMLLRSAHGVDRFEGLPGWAGPERFDVATTTSPGASLARLQSMARTLLADRFRLRAHIEQRTNDVFVLLPAKASGVLGPGLRPSARPCPREPASASVPSAPRDTQCLEPIELNENGAWRWRGRDRPLRDFLILTGARQEVGDPIVDRTGLEGRFDIDLEFAPQAARERSPGGLGLPYSVAVETQLGLRFERRQEPIDVLVVEHVALPAPD